MMRHVLLFERDERRIQHRIDRQMPFTAAQPKPRLTSPPLALDKLDADRRRNREMKPRNMLNTRKNL